MTKILLQCSFCDKKQNEVKKLISSKHRNYICDECIHLCIEILRNQNLLQTKAEMSLDTMSKTEINSDIQKHEDVLVKLKQRLSELSKHFLAKERLVSEMKKCRCGGTLQEVERSYLTGIAPVKSLECVVCKDVLMLFSRLGEIPYFEIWLNDKMQGEGFTMFVKRKIEEQQLH